MAIRKPKVGDEVVAVSTSITGYYVPRDSYGTITGIRRVQEGSVERVIIDVKFNSIDYPIGFTPNGLRKRNWIETGVKRKQKRSEV